MKVLIGYDGSGSARDAIHGLHRAGLPRDAHLLVVSVADVWPRLPRAAYEPAGGESCWQNASIVRKAHALAAESRVEAQSLSAEGAALVKSEFSGWNVTHAVY